MIAQMPDFLLGHLQPGPRGKIKAALTYFQNKQPLMNYALHLEQNLPIGSGVTEAACKTIVKQRLCCEGMKWKEAGATSPQMRAALRYRAQPGHTCLQSRTVVTVLEQD